jgi:hypothetical protein
MSNKTPKDLEDGLYKYTKKTLFGNNKIRTLEDAFEEALDLKPKQIDEIEDDQCI